MRYQYTSPYYNRTNNQTPQGVKLLIIINIVIFLLFNNSELIYLYFALTPQDVLTNMHLWQCITYAFLHGSILHLVFNRIGLWFLGSELEYRWGARKFIQYYGILAGGSGLITALYMLLVLDSNNQTIGASGAIYGLLIPYTLLFPNRLIYIYGIFPIKVKTAAIIFGSISFFYTAIPYASTSNTSHICHLAGMLVSASYLLYQYKLKKQTKGPRLYKKTGQQDEKDNTIKKHMNDILDRMNDFGWESLSEEDKEYLQKKSKHYNDLNKPNLTLNLKKITSPSLTI